MNGKTIYHVCLGDDNHHYFGSITAIFDKFTPADLGISKTSLWLYGIALHRPYRNDKCIIYKGIIARKRTNRGKTLRK